MLEKIELFTDLTDKEKAKLPKFYPSLALVTVEEIKSALKELNAHDARIEKASDIKVVVNGASEINKKYGILEQIGEEQIFSDNVSYLNKNAIEIYKRISYCMQNSIDYKNAEGKYSKFLFSDELWKKEIENPNVTKSTSSSKNSPSKPLVDVNEEKKSADNVIAFPSSESIVEKNASSDEDKSNEMKNEYENIRTALEETRKALAEQFLTFGELDEQDLSNEESSRRAI